MDKFNYSLLVQLIVKWVCHIRIKIIHVNRKGPSWLWQVAGSIPTYAISGYHGHHHWSYEFESRTWRDVHSNITLHVYEFVSDLRKFGSFFLELYIWFSSTLNKTYRHDYLNIVESGVKQ